MPVSEAEAYVRGVQRRYRPGWEQARLVAFCVLRPWSKDLRIDDVMRFPWSEEESVETMSEDEELRAIESLRAMAKDMERKMNERYGSE